MPSEDAPWGTRTCMAMFDAWRGVVLIGRWKNSQASECAKGLATNYTREQVVQARTDMEADQYYIDRGGCDICDVANNIHKYLKRRQSKVIAFRSKQQLLAQTEDLVEWQGRMMTVTEADALGFNGGFGAYL
jgi:hypothetical protein